MLDPLEQLAGEGFEITLLPVIAAPGPEAGPNSRRSRSPRPSATNDAGLRDAGQQRDRHDPAVGRDRPNLPRSAACSCTATRPKPWARSLWTSNNCRVDLMSFTAHKIYGPKGSGRCMFADRRPRCDCSRCWTGGGQEGGLRSGTLNVPGIVGFARALSYASAKCPASRSACGNFAIACMPGFRRPFPEPFSTARPCDPPDWRLPGNLNLSFAGVDGETLLMNIHATGAQLRQRLHLGHPGAEPRLAGPGPHRRGRSQQHSLWPGEIQHVRRGGICHHRHRSSRYPAPADGGVAGVGRAEPARHATFLPLSLWERGRG